MSNDQNSYLSASTHSLRSNARSARKTKRTKLVRSGLRSELLLAALSLSACGSENSSDKNVMRIDLGSWKQDSGENFSIADADPSDPWVTTDMPGDEPIDRLELVLPDHTSPQNSFEVIEIPASVSEVVVNADGAHTGPKALILDFEPRGSGNTTPTIKITPNAQSDDINEYALEVVGLSSIIISHDASETLSSISGPVLSDITAVGDGALDILSTGQATVVSEQAKLAFDSSGNNGSISITVTSRPGEVDIVGTEYSDVVTLYGNFEQGQYQLASVDQFANGSDGAYEVGGNINFGAGIADTLVIYGSVDVRTLDLSGVEKLEVNSDLIVGASQLISLEEITFTHNSQNSVSSLIVIDDMAADTDDKSSIAEEIFSKIIIEGEQTVNVASGVEPPEGSSENDIAVVVLDMSEGQQALSQEYQDQLEFNEVQLTPDTLDVDIDSFKSNSTPSNPEIIDTPTSTPPTDTTPSTPPIDTTPPAQPTLEQSEDGNTLTITGEAGATVTILDGTTDVTSKFEVTESSGTYTAVAKPGEFDGEELSLTVVVTDAAGNASVASDAVSGLIDTTPPAKPTLTSVADTDNTNYDQGFTVTEGSDVDVTVDGAALSSTDLAAKFTKSTASNLDTYTAKEGAFTGSETITVDATITDDAGNQSAAATQLTLQNVDTTPPAQPTLTVAGLRIEAKSNEDLSGMGAKIMNGVTDVTSRFDIYFMSSGSTASSRDTIYFSPKEDEFDGEELSLTVVVTDVAGNASDASEPVTTSFDTTPPAQPTLEQSEDGKTLTISGEAGATVMIYSGSDDISSKFTVTESSGTYTAVAKDVAFDGEELSLTVVLRDANFLRSDASELLTASLDTTSPTITSATTATAVDDNSGSGQVVYTAIATDGSSTLTYSLGGDDASAFTINATTGDVTLTGNPDFETQESYTFDVVATDAAGNAATQNVTLGVNNSVEIISLADTDFGGQLINPVTVDGRTYYHWDYNNSGNSEGDKVDHNLLDTLFNSGSDTTNDLNVANVTTAEGQQIQLRLPELGLPNYIEGTALSGRHATDLDLNDTGGLLAIWKNIWDQNNNSGSDGLPDDWSAENYWAATKTGSNNHAKLNLFNSHLNGRADGEEWNVALEVM